MYKEFILTFLLSFTVLKVNSHSDICDIGCTCNLRSNGDQDLGEYVDCSHKAFVLKTSVELPKTIYSLDLSMTNLSVIEPSSLYRSKTMKELYLNNNAIKELNNVFSLPELKLLDLSYNALESIHEDAFANLRKLEYLNLANNKFKTFDKLMFHHLGGLIGIVLDYNDIGASLRRENLFSRNGFGLTNKIKNLSLRGVSLNKVTDNFFVDAYDLRRLVISGNNLTEIFEIPFTLEHLDLSDNPITAITSEDFSDLPALKELKLNNLRIEKVPEYVFSPLHGLKRLELERNRNLTQFSPLAFGRGVLEDADDFILERLSLKGSRLVTLDEKLSEPFAQLIELDLQGNHWKCDCNILWLKKLQIDERDRQEIRCALPGPLYNKPIFQLEDKYFTCTHNTHFIGISMAIVFGCLLLSTVALWVFLFVPRYQSRGSFLTNWYMPSTAYAVLPLSVSEPNESRV